MMLLVKSVFVASARKRGFPAIVSSAMWFFRQGSGLIGLVAKLSCLACQQSSPMGESDCQVGFVGFGLFGGGISPAVVS
jgi:hypothetical protein